MAYSSPKRRPDIQDAQRRRICREAGYRCANCRRPVVTVHHIIPWREALARFGNANPEPYLIALCGLCHVAADAKQISPDALRHLKTELARSCLFPGNICTEGGDTLAQGADLAEIVSDFDWAFRRHALSPKQYKDILSTLHKSLDVIKPTEHGRAEFLISYARFLRLQGSLGFTAAEAALETAIGIVPSDSTQIRRIWYQQAYIHYLRHDYVAAQRLFKRASIGRDSTAFMSALLIDISKWRGSGRFDIKIFSGRPFSCAGGVGNKYYLAFAEAHAHVGEQLVRAALLDDKAKISPRDVFTAMNHWKTYSTICDALAVLPSPDYHRINGGLLLLDKQYERAAAVLECAVIQHQLLHDSELTAETLYLSGMACEKMGDHARAKDLYRKATNCDPGMDNIHAIALAERRLESMK